MKRRFFSALLSAFLLTVSTTGLTAFAEESSLPEATEKILTESVPTSEAPVCGAPRVRQGAGSGQKD